MVTKTKKITNIAKTKPSAVVKRNQIILKAEYETKLAEFNKVETEKGKLIVGWGQRLHKARVSMHKLNAAYREYLYKILQEAYAVYKEVIVNENADSFFAEIRGLLIKENIKIQSNTSDAALIIRYVCGADVSTKTVHDYSRTLMGGDYNNIEPEKFAEWLKKITMTKVIEEQRTIENEIETPAEKLERARRIVMRLIEAKETKPLLSGKTTAWKAERLLGREGLWIGVGNATRRQDRESFYADINLTMFLPPNIEIERYIINSLARYVMSNIERFEKDIATLEEHVWADSLWEHLVSSGFEESDKVNMYWSNRQQAALYENQQKFNEEIAKPKKAALQKKKRANKKAK